MPDKLDLIISKVDKLTGQVDKVTGLYADLKQEFTMLNGAVSRIENEGLPTIETKIEKVKIELKTDISRVERKLDEHMRQPAHI